MPGFRRARRRRRRQARRRIALVGGMVAVGVKKMSEAHAKQIEEHTGVPPEELEDEDLSEAMQELGIPNVEADPSELGQGRCDPDFFLRYKGVHDDLSHTGTTGVDQRACGAW